jgi:hypothetical protein
MTKLLNLRGIIVEDSKETEEILILSVIVEKKTAGGKLSFYFTLLRLTKEG